VQSRTTGKAERLIRATPERLWQAWFGEGELMRWFIPNGLSGQMIEFNPTPQGMMRFELSFYDHTACADDSSGTIEVRARYVSLNPPYGFVLEVFPPEDRVAVGVIQHEWQFLQEADRTRVVITCYDMPLGMTPEMNAQVLGSALPRLAAYVE
jgi:uncharacterized protein YndB with AHSA1/START domain